MGREWAAFMQRDYVLRPGDRITVTVYPEVDLTQEVQIPPTGTVHLMRLEDGIRAVGVSMGAFRAIVQEAYLRVLTNAEVSVSLVEPSAKSIYVTGEVLKPGPVPYTPGMTATQAISAAGGMRMTAKSNDVRILRGSGTPEFRTDRFNVASTLVGEQPDYILLPGDVIYCQTSSIADAGNWMQLYIRNLLPIGNPQTFFIGF
jgi:protein involved in polysaccharide export with SLBB domain